MTDKEDYKKLEILIKNNLKRFYEDEDLKQDCLVLILEKYSIKDAILDANKISILRLVNKTLCKYKRKLKSTKEFAMDPIIIEEKLTEDELYHGIPDLWDSELTIRPIEAPDKVKGKITVQCSTCGKPKKIWSCYLRPDKKFYCNNTCKGIGKREFWRERRNKK